MRILEVCPECGADIEYIEICTNPPIPVRKCKKCNWIWEGKPEETVRVPFNPVGYGQCEITIPTGEYDLTVPTQTIVHIRT